MSFVQDIAHAITQPDVAQDVEKLKQSTLAVCERIAKQRKNKELPLYVLPDRSDDLPEIERVAERMRSQFEHVVVLGTGGSSLGGLTLVSLLQGDITPKDTPRLHFIDNVDPHTLDHMLTSLDLSRTGVICISKSGTTVETLSQTLLFMEAVKAKSGEAALAKQFVFITIPSNSPMRRLAQRYNIETLEHDPKLGGRFSVLSSVGLLPAAIAGLDIKAIRNGAHQALEQCHEAAEGAALHHAYMRKGCNIAVLMPYADRLNNLARWYQQIWAESLGKNGYGSTPVRALGAVDQHSQLQLYLDGPRDKLLTLITLEHAGQGPKIIGNLSDDKDLNTIRGRHIGDVMSALQEGTTQTLIRNQVPLRLIKLKQLDETAMGRLLMHFMLETIITAGLAEVDAFDQPAVEEGKQLARSYLLATA